MTNAELGVLGLVAEQPRHGYQIERVIEERGMRKWTDIGFSSIYFLLKKLEREGLVEGQLENTGRGPARKVYRATPAGLEAFHIAVVEALSVPETTHKSLLLGLANLPAISLSEAIAALGQYIHSLRSKMEILRSFQESRHEHPYFVEAMFDHNLTVMHTELQWAERFMKQIQDRSQTEQE